MVISYIKETCPETEVSLLTMKTTGDIILDRTLDKVGGKGLFVKELDKALLDRRSDLPYTALRICRWKFRMNFRSLHFRRGKTREMFSYCRRGRRNRFLKTCRLFQPEKNSAASGTVSAGRVQKCARKCDYPPGKTGQRGVFCACARCGRP